VTAVAASEPVAETPAARKQPPVATVAAQETTAERPTAAAPPSASPSAPSFATVPEARPARAAAGGGAIRVQFAAFRSQAEAEDSWRRLVATAPDAFAGIVPVIEPGYSGSDPTLFYRLRSAPFATRAEASDFCTRLKPRGIDCIVVRDPAPPKQP
jgi:cell division protein FtsN